MNENKSESAREIIAKIVREELQKLLPPTLLQEIANSGKPQLRSSSPPTSIKKYKTAVVKTGNSAIDKILAETNIDSFGDRYYSDQPSVMSESANQLVGSNIPLPSTDINGLPLSHIPEAIANTLNRDFSAILKKSMERKNGKPL